MVVTNHNTPFFSVVIPTYNRASSVVAALMSVMKQGFKDFEVIVVDDGSTDTTRNVLTEMASNNPSIKYFHKENEERSIARNYGIMKASGKYIGFLDSDDILYPNHFEVAYALLKRHNFPEVGHLGYEFVDDTRKPVLIRNSFDDSFREKLIHENIIHGNAIFIRKDVAEIVNFIPSKAAILSEDWYLWLRLAARYPFYFDNTVTSAIVNHDGRSLMNIDPDRLIASTEVIVEYLKRDQIFLDVYKNKTSYHFANHYTFLSLILALTKKRRIETMKYLAKAIQHDPTVIFRRRFLASVKHLF